MKTAADSAAKPDFVQPGHDVNSALLGELLDEIQVFAAAAIEKTNDQPVVGSLVVALAATSTGLILALEMINDGRLVPIAHTDQSAAEMHKAISMLNDALEAATIALHAVEHESVDEARACLLAVDEWRGALSVAPPGTSTTH